MSGRSIRCRAGQGPAAITTFLPRSLAFLDGGGPATRPTCWFGNSRLPPGTVCMIPWKKRRSCQPQTSHQQFHHSPVPTPRLELCAPGGLAPARRRRPPHYRLPRLAQERMIKSSDCCSCEAQSCPTHSFTIWRPVSPFSFTCVFADCSKACLIAGMKCNLIHAA